jgi:hypothetical protein
MVFLFSLPKKGGVRKDLHSSPIDPNYFASLSFVYDEDSVNEGRVC